MSVAAIDLGSGATRLLILDDDGRELAREATVTLLGAGVDVARRLAPDAIERTLDCLRAYKAIIDAHRPTRIRVVATSAARDAANRPELFDAVEGVLAVAPELLSGADEGRLGFAGATTGLYPRTTPFGEDALDLVVDIGGGSTEFSVGRPGAPPVGVWSVDIGSVRVTEQFLHDDPPSAEDLSNAVTVVRLHLEDVVREIPLVREASRLIGVAGSVTTVAAVEIGLLAYDRARIHHFELTRNAVEDVFRTLATENRRDRAFNPGLAVERVDTIVAGSLILATVMRHFAFDACLVSEHDLLDGVAAELLAR